jgi:hypothetical protein
MPYRDITLKRRGVSVLAGTVVFIAIQGFFPEAETGQGRFFKNLMVQAGDQRFVWFHGPQETPEKNVF